ncbi:MAG: type I-A CRISPR-associated protein Cas4/Csa1 [Chloroflexi bacterium]|nr:type I-A CRISPR-associated protein Cas4/Csa1 [Chloroflexota bacterium]
MYFLSDEERSFLTGRLLPEARQHGVHPELRGWSWQQPPLSPVYDIRLTVGEVANQYCGTGRDVYLRRVLGAQAKPNAAMREGATLHRVLAELIVRAKRTIYEHGPDACLRHLAELAEASGEAAEAFPGNGGPRTVEPVAARGNGGTTAGALAVEAAPRAGEQVASRAKVAALTAFEQQRIVGRVQEILAREPRVGADALATLALPVTVERQLNGVFVGLASHLAADAVGTFEGIIFDVKFGERREFHRLTTAAYALVLESLYGYPVDVGCLIYVTFAGERVLVERDLHVLDDELRQGFVEARDERTRLVSEEIDPGRADDCHETCPYWQRCRSG